MSGIKHSTATQNYKDQTLITYGITADEFDELYAWICDQFKKLATIQNPSIFEAELEKVKPRAKKLINKYFHPSLLDLGTQFENKEKAAKLKQKLETLDTVLNLQQY